MSEKELTERVREDLEKCPYCDKDNICQYLWDGPNPLVYDVECHECGRSWKNVFEYAKSIPEENKPCTT